MKNQVCDPYTTSPPCWGCNKLLSGCTKVWKPNSRGGFDLLPQAEFYEAYPHLLKAEE